MKKILIHNCKSCPYVEFDIHDTIVEKNKRPIGIAVYRCNHVSLERYGKWTNGEDIPEECPLEDL